jgi:four helix bundle protein
MARSYRDLVVWQKAKILAVAVYKASEKFPKHDLYGLTSQIRRSAVSVPSNIAEGQGRLGPAEFRHFLGQARGSLLELDTQISIARDLSYLDDADYTALDAQIYAVLGLLNKLLDSLREKNSLKP